MPAIRHLYLRHPTTGVAGIWIDTVHFGLVGAAESTFPAQPTSGTTAAKMTAYGTTLSNMANGWCQLLTPTSLLAGLPILTTPEPDCSIIGTNYVAQVVRVIVTVTSLSPLRYGVEVTDGASRVHNPP